MKYLSHILMTFIEQYRHLSVSFVIALLQKVHDLKQVSLYLKSGKSYNLSLISIVTLETIELHSYCHL